MNKTITLRLERFGDWKPWVAIIQGFHPKYNFDRIFLDPHVDYTQANSKGSRGVFYYYHLQKGDIYEIKKKTSWNNTEQYFCIIRYGEIRKVKYSFVVEMIEQANA